MVAALERTPHEGPVEDGRRLTRTCSASPRCTVRPCNEAWGWLFPHFTRRPRIPGPAARGRAGTARMDEDFAYHVRHRAYELWVENGRPDGQHLQFWEAAEKELLAKRAAQSPEHPRQVDDTDMQ